MSEGDVEAVLPVAMDAHERRALRPMVDSLATGARAYLRACLGKGDAGSDPLSLLDEWDV